jgi:periplasmic copper chaperone A
MHPVERIEVPAGGSVSLEPGGYHIMLINLTQELEVGGTIDLTVTFEKAGDIKVTAEVRAAS